MGCVVFWKTITRMFVRTTGVNAKGRGHCCFVWVLSGVIFFFFSIFQLRGQAYMVFFEDKAGTPFSLREPARYLSERSLKRREKYGISVSEQDLPVSPAYVEVLGQLGGLTVSHTTRWMNGVLVYVEAGSYTEEEEAYEVMSQLDFVRDVRLVSTEGKQAYVASDALVASHVEAGSARPTGSDLHHKLMGLDKMHEMGYMGQGVYVAVFDNTFAGVDVVRAFDHLHEQERVLYTYDFIREHTDVYRGVVQPEAHGAGVLSLLSADQPNFYRGAAPHVDLALFLVGEISYEQPIEEYFFLFAAEKADALGVDIITASLSYRSFHGMPERVSRPFPGWLSPSGTGEQDPQDVVRAYSYRPEDLDGMTTVSARAANAAYARGILVVSSAGNTHAGIDTPADSPIVIAVGSIDYQGAVAPFSAEGPNAAQQIKPDVVTYGVDLPIFSVESVARSSTGGIRKVERVDFGLTDGTGTSYSAPLVAGLLAGLVQCYPQKDYREIRDILLKSAHRCHNPDNSFGHGVPHFLHAVNAAQWGLSAQDDTRGRPVVFPNPLSVRGYAAGRLYVVLPLSTLADVYVSSLDGRRVLGLQDAYRVTDALFFVDFSSVPAGVYALYVVARKREEAATQAVRVVYRP